MGNGCCDSRDDGHQRRNTESDQRDGRTTPGILSDPISNQQTRAEADGDL